ncbi:Thymine dioxygenase [Mycena indigotica]|uniref:Thymine dioxygenase n=1 Tax=Mycena indigotica TaxID=2126181 RepID=A0A8H6S3U1_9AGAR|nr:Thymine dioxygenase [Mycena indigotica]KAF7292213.1 Thymine dioxygenase [Mycena indigotica]
MSSIPVVDFAPFLASKTTPNDESEQQKQAVAAAILDSFKRIGFVYLVNHGMAQSEIDEMFAVSKSFFALPLETKLLAPRPAAKTHHRGYSELGREKVTQPGDTDAYVPDTKESFECGADNDAMPNVWPPEEALPGFRAACDAFYARCYELEQNILRAIALGFRLPEDYFLASHPPQQNQLRLLHYPPVSQASLEEGTARRMVAHTDFITITLLFQDDVGGLEVEDPAQPGVYIAAQPIPGAVIVNAGDLLKRWSNDVIKSTKHRVRAPPTAAKDGVTPARYSIPYFCGPLPDTVVDCMPGTFDPSQLETKRYAPITAGDYVMHRLADSY